MTTPNDEQTQRTQPEFSTGERLATLERQYAALAARVDGHGQLDDHREKALEGMLASLEGQLDRRIIHQEEALRAATSELETRIRNLRELLDAAGHERERAQEKFEETVRQRFVQQNELRGALDDLSQNMATRRELETTLENIKGETRTALATASATTDELRNQITELRSRLDVGPPELRTLASRSDQSVGAEHRGQQLNTTLIAWAGVALIIISTAISIAIRLAG